jgi:hypothetical protein
MTDLLRACRLALVVLPLPPGLVFAGPTTLDDRLHHLRAGDEREWADFPAKAEGPRLSITFRAARNAAEQTLRLRQQDVKQTWRVVLNGKDLGRLIADENDTELVLPVPPGRLVDGDNSLVIEATGKTSDDIRVGEIALDDRPTATMLSEATVEVIVREDSRPVPCRITIVNSRGALAATNAKSTDRLAVRPGVIYTADGTARFGMPAGDYTLHAGRGFEYGIATERIALKPGDTLRKELVIHREVATPGYVACDTHVHTLTHSGHGDSTDVERAITLAGEGIELPIATEHNLQVDYHAAAVKAGVRGYFTPVVGNEVTTAVGHFNVFPLSAAGPVPDYRGKDWKAVADALGRPAGPRVVILNHPRDKHLGFVPFGPARHLALTGESLDGWELPANAMEVVNSGAQQSDVLLPVRDWFGMLNRGAMLTPTGSSDSHDVSRYIVGQGRTYLRCKDDKPGEIDVAEAVRNFLAGRVLVSCGLLAEITVNGKHGPGDLVPVGDEVSVAVRVLGPSWATADRVELYANGIKVRETTIADNGKPGAKWSGEWKLPRPKHDVHLVAVASGPGVEAMHWPIGKPYQPVSPVVRKRVLGVTGAVWFDADGDGRPTPALAVAQKIVDAAGDDWRKAIRGLAGCDEAVAAQAASLLRTRGHPPTDTEVRDEARAAGEAVLRGFDTYSAAWRESAVARSAAGKATPK